MSKDTLYEIAHNTLVSLSTEEGINASGKNEIFGCIFGRDLSISAIKILNAHKKRPVPTLVESVNQGLRTLVSLQGKEFNIESGEEPGRGIHEFRRTKFEHLLTLDKPWFVYPDGLLRNYDSIDSTPLLLIAIYKFWDATKDNKFLADSIDAVDKGLNWIITYGDKNKDTLIEYHLPEERKSGGLIVQSWTDSHESMRKADGSFPKYPISPVEAQGYAWLALKQWGEFYKTDAPEFSKKLLSQADRLKEEFNKRFLIEDSGLKFFAQALDGDFNQIKTITINPLLCLWSAYKNEYGKMESIIDDKYIDDVVRRSFMEDMFAEGAGIRTMSKLSPTFNPNQDSYHNGSIWPWANGAAIEGLENFNYQNEAQQLTNATLNSIEFFGSPIELFVEKDQQLLEFDNGNGQVSCKEQAWSAAAVLDLTS